MKLELTRRGDYAIRAMLALAAEHAGDGVTAPQIADQMRIPSSFLARVMADLTRSGLVEARIGRRGGYRLARPAADITLLEVIETIEGDARRITCVMRNGPCSVDGRCIAHAAFYSAQEAMRESLASTTLESMRVGAAGP